MTQMGHVRTSRWVDGPLRGIPHITHTWKYVRKIFLFCTEANDGKVTKNSQVGILRYSTLTITRGQSSYERLGALKGLESPYSVITWTLLG